MKRLVIYTLALTASVVFLSRSATATSPAASSDVRSPAEATVTK